MTNVEILLKEYDSLRTEVLERIKIAFSHMGYAGAIVAFAYPIADKTKDVCLVIGLAIVGFLSLAYFAALNWIWVGRIATHLRSLEERINRELVTEKDEPLLAWEKIVSKISCFPLCPPKKYPGT